MVPNTVADAADSRQSTSCGGTPSVTRERATVRHAANDGSRMTLFIENRNQKRLKSTVYPYSILAMAPASRQLFWDDRALYCVTGLGSWQVAWQIHVAQD